MRSTDAGAESLLDESRDGRNGEEGSDGNDISNPVEKAAYKSELEQARDLFFGLFRGRVARLCRL